MTSGDRTTSGYSGALEVRIADGELLGLLHAGIDDLDAPVWSAESTEPLNLQRIDPGGETVTVTLADGAHPRSGQVATAHLQIRNGHVRLAGNYGFHRPGE